MVFLIKILLMEENYSIKVSESGKYVLVDLKGIITPDIAYRFTFESDKLALEHGIFSFMLDLRGARNMATKKNNLDFTKESSNYLIEDSKKKIASLTDEIDNLHDFIVLMMKKRGVNMKVFHVFEEAEKFLES